MTKIKRNKCKAEGCNLPVWGRGYCRYHQYLIKRGGAPRAKIHGASDKRRGEAVLYKRVCDYVDESTVLEHGYLRCWFSGEEIIGTPDHHHIRGRAGSYYTDKNNIKPVKREYHMSYHHDSYEKLSSHVWYKRFLAMLKREYKDIYYKEIRRANKK